MGDKGVEALHRLDTHEAVCAERYSHMIDRIGRLESMTRAVTGGVIVQLLCVVGYLLNQVVAG